MNACCAERRLRIFWLLACLASLALVPVHWTTPTSAQTGQASPSPRLKDLQEALTDLHKTGTPAQKLYVAEQILTQTIREYGAAHEQTGIQLQSVGALAQSAGLLAEAERHFDAAHRIAEQVYGVDSAAATQPMEKRGSVLLAMGRHDEAEALFKRVLAIRSDLVGRDHAYTASAHADLASVNLARRNYPQALAGYREAIRLLTTQRTMQTLARSVSDGEIRRHRGAFTGLAQAAWESAGPSDSDRRTAMDESFAASQQAWLTSAASALARMSARLGAGQTNLGRSIRSLQDKSERILALHEDDMRSLAARNELQRQNPDYVAALAAFRQASIERARDSAPVAHQQKRLVDQLQEVLRRCPPGKRISGCEGSDRDRERITRELAGAAAAASKGTGELMALHQRLQAADSKIPGLAAFNARRSALIDESVRLEQEITQARAAIVKAFPDYVALTEPSPLAIAETQALLRPDEALVTVLVGQSKSFVWAISRERADWAAIETGTPALVEQVTALRRGLDHADPATPADKGSVAPGYDLERAHALYRLVLEPVEAVLKDKQHLIVVPTGPLTSLPFQLLLTEAPAVGVAPAHAMRAAPWLIRRHALSTLPSVQALAALRRLVPANAPPKPFLGIGDPVFSGGKSVRQPARGRAVAAMQPASIYRNGRPDLRALRNLEHLPETAIELQLVAKALGAGDDALLLGENATEQRVKRSRLEDYRVIQFATHGVVSGELSGLAEPALVLTPPETESEFDDGLLTASEVATLRLSAEWVVLSACNTASGTDAGAEALSGLARAFFHAGARALLVSHWAVDSAATVSLTTRTFAALAADRRLSRAEAFRRSMIAMVDAGHSPSEWAPFVIVGDGGTAGAAKPAR